MSPPNHHFLIPKDEEIERSLIRVDFDRVYIGTSDEKHLMCSCCLTFISPVQNGENMEVRAWKCLNSEAHDSDPSPAVQPEIEGAQTDNEIDLKPIIHFQVKHRGFRCNRCYFDEGCQTIPCGEVGKCKNHLYNWRYEDSEARSLLLDFIRDNDLSPYGVDVTILPLVEGRSFHLQNVWDQWLKGRRPEIFEAERKALVDPEAEEIDQDELATRPTHGPNGTS